MQFEQVLEAFTDFFVREDIPYVIIGGLAVHAWGLSRTTHDLDFAVEGSTQQKVIAYTESLGFATVFVGEGYSIEYLISLPGVDRSFVRDYFRRSGLLKLYDDYLDQDS